MNKLKVLVKVLLIVFLIVFSFVFNNRCFADLVATEFPEDEVTQRDTSVMEDPTVNPEENKTVTETKKSRSTAGTTKSSGVTENSNRNQYFVVGIVLLLVAAIDALIIIKIAKKKK